MTSELEQDSGLTPPAMLTVAAGARRLGVAPSTLRTWDRRYGLGPSPHTAGAHRPYSPSDVTRLVVMRGLVVEGVPPAEAAQIALSTPVDSESHERPAAGSAGAGSAAASAVERAMPVRGIGTSAAEPGALSSSWAAPAPPRHPGQSVRGQSGAARGSGSAALSPVVEPPAPSVPASRGMPLHEGVPRPDDVLHPEGAGRAVWPMSPLAAQHLLQAEGAAAAPSVVPVPGHLLGDPAAAEGDVLDPVALEAAGRDAALAGVIADALRRSGPGPDHPGWSGPTGRAGGGRVISLPDASPRA